MRFNEFTTAKQDIILQNMLNKVEVYFKLKKPNA